MKIDWSESIKSKNVEENDQEEDRPTDGLEAGNCYQQKFKTTGMIQILVFVARRRKLF